MGSDDQHLRAPSESDANSVGCDGPSSSRAVASPHGSPVKAPEHGRARLPQAERLVDMEPDLMTLHTREAYWLFSGRPWTSERRRIIGGQRAAAALNSLRHISVEGNPYADWFLLSFEAQLAALRNNLTAVRDEYQTAIDELKGRGLELRVLGSRSPVQISVAFGSAYGYAIAETIVEFDYYVRMLKTLVLKNRITADQGRASIRGVARPLRRLFVRVIQWEHGLRLPEWRVISRKDYLESADEDAKKRVLAAFARFGPIPQRILAGTTVPRHVVRRTASEQKDPLTIRSQTASTVPEASSPVLV